MTDEELINRFSDRLGQIYFRHKGNPKLVYEYLEQHDVPYRNLLSGFSITDKDIALKLVLKYSDHIKLEMP